VTHPSSSHYLAAISGDFQGAWDDCRAGATVTCPPEEFVPGAGDARSTMVGPTNQCGLALEDAFLSSPRTRFRPAQARVMR
jgi:hypothetical protein